MPKKYLGRTHGRLIPIGQLAGRDMSVVCISVVENEIIIEPFPHTCVFCGTLAAQTRFNKPVCAQCCSKTSDKINRRNR